MSPEIYEYLLELEKEGLYDPHCKTCENYFLPMLIAGKKLHEIFAPRHRPMFTCKSGKNPHCTCDTCF